MSPPYHHISVARLSHEDQAFVERMVLGKSGGFAAKQLKVAPSTIDRLMGPGTIRTETATRITERIEELRREWAKS